MTTNDYPLPDVWDNGGERVTTNDDPQPNLWDNGAERVTNNDDLLAICIYLFENQMTLPSE